MSEVLTTDKAQAPAPRTVTTGPVTGAVSKASSSMTGQGHWTQVQMLEPKEGPPPDEDKGPARGRTGDFNPGKGSTSDDLSEARKNDGKASGQLGYQVLGVDDVSTVKTSGAIGYGADGAMATVGRERTLDSAQLNKSTNEKLTVGQSARYDHDKRRVTLGTTDKVGRESKDGSKATSEQGTRFAVGKDGFEAGHDRKSTVVDADGVKTTKSLGLTGNLTDREIGVKGSHSRTDPKNGTSQQISGGGSLKLGEHGLEKVSAEASVKVGTLTINLDGGFSFVVDEPQATERAGKRVWAMKVTKTTTSGSGMSVKGIGGGMKGTSTQVMTIVRDSREELLAMRTRGRLEAEMAKPTDRRTVHSMREGESRSSGTSKDGTLSGSAWMGVLEVGASFTAGKSQTVTVTKKAGTVVQVEIADKATSGASGKVGTAIGGIGGARAQSSTKTELLEIDVATDEGQSALDKIRQTGLRPSKGVKEVLRSDGRESVSGTVVDALGARYGDSSSVSSSMTIDSSGKTETHAGARNQTVSLPLLGSHTKSVGFHAVERNDEERSYRATAMVASAYASDASEALADATGTHTHREASGPGSGTWNISAEFSDEEVERLIGLIRNDKVVYASLGRHYKKGETLRRTVLGAKTNHDAIREALSVFVADTGAGGLAVMRKALATNPSYDIELLGDKYLTGEKVRREIEQKTADFEGRAADTGADAGKLMADIDQAIAYHRERADTISSHRNYPELPHQLRAGEVQRSREAVARYTGLRSRVAGRLQSERHSKDNDVERSTSSEQSFVEPSEAVSGGSVRGTECAPSSPEVAARTKAWSELAATKAHIETKVHSSMEKAFAEARRRHWVHSGKWSSVAPREKLGFSSLFGAGKHADDYAQAEGRIEFGKFQLMILSGQRNGLQREFESLERANLAGTPSPAEVVEGLRNRFERLVPGFGVATLSFQGATAVYRRIEAAHPTLVKWEPPQEMPDAYLR